MLGRNLFDYYRTNELLMSYGYDVEYLDNCLPYERDLYQALRVNRIREQQQIQLQL